MKIRSLLSLLLIVSFSATFAQKPKKAASDVTVTYDLTVDEGLDAQSAAMLKGSEMVVFLQGDQVKVEVTMAGSTQTVLMNTKEKTSVILIDAMGAKFKMTNPKEEEKAEEAKKPEVTYSDEVKTIAGYKCKKALVKDPETGESMVVYYTTEIDSRSQEYSYLDGFPLQYEINRGGLKMLAVAKNVSKEKIDSTIFAVPDGYQEMTPEELQRMGN